MPYTDLDRELIRDGESVVRNKLSNGCYSQIESVHVRAWLAQIEREREIDSATHQEKLMHSGVIAAWVGAGISLAGAIATVVTTFLR